MFGCWLLWAGRGVGFGDRLLALQEKVFSFVDWSDNVFLLYRFLFFALRETIITGIIIFGIMLLVRLFL